MTTSTEPDESFHIPIEAAEFYETAFVPAFFGQWAPILCEAAGVAAGQRTQRGLTRRASRRTASEERSA